MLPLFVPLKTQYYEAFASGTKRDELRKYGPRWNEKTCQVGRPVILSKGYGKQNRLRGKIRAFKKQHGTLFGSTYKQAILKCFGTLDIDVAVISIELISPAAQTQTITGRCGSEKSQGSGGRGLQKEKSFPAPADKTIKGDGMRSAGCRKNF